MTEYRASVEHLAKNGGQGDSVAIGAVETERLLASDPAAAEARARKYLTEHPDNVGARLLLGAALRRQGHFTAARAVLKPLTQSQPDLILAHFELGLALGGLGEHHEALGVLTWAIDLMPNFAPAWYALAEQRELSRRSADNHLADPRLSRAHAALREGRLATAETLLRELVKDSLPDEAVRFILSIT